MSSSKAFAYESYRHQCDQELLDRLSAAIYLLKREAQAYDEGLAADQPSTTQAREGLAGILRGLVYRVQAVTGQDYHGNLYLPFSGVADRFIETFQNDLADQLATLDRLTNKLETRLVLQPPDFQVLDDLQVVLEAEAITHVLHLFRL